MATAPITNFLQNLRRASLLRDRGSADAQLLECFAQRHDQGAFEALVHRHGPMVLGVCRRILRNHHDAEDAFQATFLVLASRAAAVRPRHMVAGWLYGVACNTALKLRGKVARQRAKEKVAASMPRPEPPSDIWHLLEPVLDTEVRALPDKYRVPIVLCDLEGKSRKEAARQLGWPEGTVASRLARARVLLSRRLARHGITLSAGALSALVAENAVVAAVPSALVAALGRIAPLLAAGQTPVAGDLSGRVLTLTQGVLKTMILTKLKIASALLVVLALVAVGATLYPSAASPQDPPQKATANSTAGSQSPKVSGSTTITHTTLDLPAVVVDEVDLKFKTVSVTVVEVQTTSSSSSSSSGSSTSGSSASTDKAARLIDLPVSKHVEIIVNSKVVPLASLQPGTKVSLRLVLDGNRLVVASMATEKKQESTAPERKIRELQELLESVERAQAKSKLAALQVQTAKQNLADAQTPEARQKAQAELELALAQLELARANAAAAADRRARIEIEYELLQKMKN